jgi:hypothetical protein
MFMEDDDVPEKLWEVKTFMRMGSDGQPQIVRVEPMITADNTFVPDMVRVYIDDQQHPTVFTRNAADIMLTNTDCKPLEEVMRYKHLMRN